MIEKLRETDFKVLDDNGVNELITELVGLEEADLKEALEVLLDEKVDLDTDVPMSLQTLFNNDKIADVLTSIDGENN